ncbi:hypothetical protein JCM31826_17290 [Thermaurantimonas aggregans]|uniref:Phosphatidylinositol-4-phosphate 5-kinase n=1 Tax=Thermaurantimonas aggregans TaxID=2173829 RepID=A0A401XMK7_9FLAO|nr:hypothetical protein [Thermaurantimonas aggregans]MCX8147702.1 hypothetical protein [Thermaurantimonas aggregans]GCD78247.1 hypothetical protein JCM31826_17290 [Thermaurantimonas aggregans]
MNKRTAYLLVTLFVVSLSFNVYQYIEYENISRNVEFLKREIDIFSHRNEILINTISKALTEEDALFDFQEDSLHSIMPDSLLQKMRILHQNIRKNSDSILVMNEMFRRFRSIIGAAEKMQNQTQLSVKELREKYLLQSAELELLKKELELSKRQANQLLNRVAEITLNLKDNIQLRYIGEVDARRPDGLGVGFYSTGGYYIGQWKDGVRHGLGEYVWKNGDRYKGEFVNDKRQGYGEYIYSNGYRYRGGWRDDLRDGYGELFNDENKRVAKGIWKNDKLTEKQ